MLQALQDGMRGEDFINRFEDYDFTFVLYCIESME